jgi:hypothetical protein
MMKIMKVRSYNGPSAAQWISWTLALLVTALAVAVLVTAALVAVTTAL